MPLVNELDITQYLNGLGREVLDAAGPQYFNCHFYVIDDEELNAFTAPSGLIFIHSGLIRKFDNENEMMSVIAHEIGHVMSRHIAERNEQAPKMTAATLALILAGMAIGAGSLSEALVMGGMATGQTMSLKYSREDEEEADRKAFELMREMNRDPKDMLSMLHKMHRLYKIRMGNIPQYLLTHPIPRNRINYIEDLINLYSPNDYKQVDALIFERIRKRMEVITGDMDKLEKEYRQTLTEAEGEKDKQMTALYGLALICHKKGRYKEAINNLNEVINVFEGMPILWTDLGRVYLDSGEIDAALRLFDKARTAEPGNMYNNYYLAQALEHKGESDRAGKLYRQISNHAEDYPPVYKHIARISDQRGKKGLSHYYLGLHYYYTGEFTVSQFHLKKARTELGKDDPKQKEVDDILARIQGYRS